MRDKWDEPRGDMSYGGRTIARAFEGRAEFYEPAGPASKTEGLATQVSPPAKKAKKVGERPVSSLSSQWSLPATRDYEAAFHGPAAAWVQSGFGSGEAVVEHVRDPSVDKDGIETDPGATDKRLLVYEGEFAQIVTVARRETSTLSALIRNAWDAVRPLQNRVKNRKLIATNAHISVLAAITPAELQSSVSDVQILSGFLNRFLLVAVQRQRFLPVPQPIPDALIEEHAKAIRRAIEFGRRQTRRIEMDEDAEAVYANAYMTWLSVDRPGILSATCSRAEAHTLRLSAIYALLDCSPTIRRQHLEAALAFWRYCEAFDQEPVT